MATAAIPTPSHQDTYTDDMTPKKMVVQHQCPHCGKTFTIPNKTVVRWSAFIISRMRKTIRGNVPLIWACPCGNFVGMTKELRLHKCRMKPPRGQEHESGIKASREQVIEYYRRRGMDVPDYVPLDEYK